MNMLMIALIFLVVVIILIFIISTTNNFKRLDIKVDESLSGIEVSLEKRYDMLTKLLEATKGYMSHEKEVYEDVIALRKGMSIDDLKSAVKKIDAMQDRVVALCEGYPELKSSDVIINLQDGIKDVEEHLQAAKRLYNANVSAYNEALAVFPSSLLKGNRTPKDFFEIEDRKKQDVKTEL